VQFLFLGDRRFEERNYDVIFPSVNFLIGEFGLDYERTQFCPVDVQKKFFEFQFTLAEESKLPLFLHLRGPATEFLDILKRNREKFSEGVVHSFDGSLDALKEIVSMGLYIGINGCSLKSQENLEVVKQIPRDKLMIETDAPWYVKGRGKRAQDGDGGKEDGM
jgi:TatD DNase family protein